MRSKGCWRGWRWPSTGGLRRLPNPLANLNKQRRTNQVSRSPSQPLQSLIKYTELFGENAKAFQGLATLKDLENLQRLYQEYFESEDVENDPPVSVQPEGELHTRLQEASNGEDLGIEEEAGMDAETLATRLGFFKDKLPAQFNRYRHRMGRTPWSNPSDFEGAGTSSELSENLTPLALHWHQLAGIHSIIRTVFAANSMQGDGTCKTGMLVCDEVGLGKTAMAISTIAFLNQVLFSGQKGSPPPILGELFQL